MSLDGMTDSDWFQFSPFELVAYSKIESSML